MLEHAGYSQGAMIVRKTFMQLSNEARARVTGIILFGDPAQWGTKLPGGLDDRVLNLHIPFDLVDLSIPIVTMAHFAYPLCFDDAVNFIQSKVTS